MTFVQLNSQSRKAKSHLVGYMMGGPDECWPWIGGTQSDGYGKLWTGSKHVLGHRYVYEMEKGIIPAGLELDHLCRNVCCVNPAHLEAVTHRTNMLRGNGVSALAMTKTHCPAGHLLAGENLRPSLAKRGLRECRVCKNTKALERYHAKRVAA